jgi:hypothetical protein
MPFLIIVQEVVNHFNSSSTATYITINETIKTFLSSFEKMDLHSNFHYMLFFIQQKFNNKLSDFINNKDLSVLLKLIYLFKYSPKEEIIVLIEKLESFYEEKGLLEGLIITGNSENSITLLQNYLNNSDDLLVTLILSKFFIDHNHIFVKKCETELFETLNRMRMFTERIHLNQKLNEIISHISSINIRNISGDKKHLMSHNMTEWVINCFYCNIKIHAEKTDQFRYLMMNNKDGTEWVKYN